MRNVNFLSLKKATLEWTEEVSENQIYSVFNLLKLSNKIFKSISVEKSNRESSIL
jgi:hypothetical protein